MAKDPYKYFRIEARELLEQLGQGVLDLEKGTAAAELVPRLMRWAHTLKGAARVVRQPEIADGAHRIEDVLAPWRENASVVPHESVLVALAGLDQIGALVAALPAAAAAAASPGTVPASAEEAPRSLRADLGDMDGLLAGVAETHAHVAGLRHRAEDAAIAKALAQRLQSLLLHRHSSGGEPVTGGAAGDPVHALVQALQHALGQLERDLNTSTEHIERELRQLRDSAEQLRLVAAATLFNSLERSARDIAQTLGKRVLFEGLGGEVKLDVTVLDGVHAALLQLVRNAAAHGVETPAARLAAGKPPEGRVTIEVLRQQRQVVFRCRDDGAGIDLDAVRRGAQRKGLLDASSASDADADALLRLLLRGGLSTSGAVTEVAGRGVGLDVAGDAARRLGGELTVHTVAGRGTTFDLRVPLSLASLEALMVEVAGSALAIPLDALHSTLRIASQDIARSANGDTLTYDGQAVPYVAMASLLDPAIIASARHRVSVLIVEHGGTRVALGVDRLRAIATIMLRPLPEFASATAIVAGVSLDVEGNPQLVMDAAGLVLAAQSAGANLHQKAPTPVPVLVVDDSLTTRMLEQSILESAGYEVHAAVSGEEGLELARRQPCALFLVDVEMPGMDGFTFIERARADPELRHVPAMLITSRSSPADRQRGLEVGAQGYIVKSEFVQTEFLARVRQLVQTT